MPKNILAAATGVGQSNEVIVTEAGKTVVDMQIDIAEGAVVAKLPVHFTCPGIATGETGTLQKKGADDNFTDYALPGNEHIINDLRSGVAVYAPGIYRIDKSITVASVPVEISTSDHP